MNKITTNYTEPVPKGKHWSKEQINWLKENYPLKGKQYCANYLKRSLSSVRWEAFRLKIKFIRDISNPFFKDYSSRGKIIRTGRRRPAQSIVMKNLYVTGKLTREKTLEERKLMSDRAKLAIAIKGHPRGMLGKHHGEDVIKNMRIRYKAMWKDPFSKVNSQEHKQAQSDRQTKFMAERIRTKGSIYSRAHSGWYEISNTKYYFRSSWEVNYARYLEWQLLNKQIMKWTYEEDTFWFEKIKRGVRSYKPDFKVTKLNEIEEYHEVKGYMDNKSKTKIKRMAIYYPQTKLIVIEKIAYKSVLQYEKLYPIATKISD